MPLYFFFCFSVNQSPQNHEIIHAAVQKYQTPRQLIFQPVSHLKGFDYRDWSLSIVMQSRNDSAATFNRRSERVPEKTKYMYTRAGSGRWKMGGRGEEGPGVEGRGGRGMGRILTFVLYTGDFCWSLISL